MRRWSSVHGITLPENEALCSRTLRDVLAEAEISQHQETTKAGAGAYHADARLFELNST
jgi:hypothetical protein